MSLRKGNTPNGKKKNLKENEQNQQNEYDTLDFDDSEELEAYLSDSISKVTGQDEKEPEVYDSLEEAEQGKRKWSIKKKIFVTTGSAIGAIAILCVFLISYGLFRINYANSSQRAESDLTAEELAAQETLPPRTEEQIKLDEQVINILLIGEEKIGSGDANGRSDSMMIASMNTETKSLKLVSIMRDCYVSIPGYRDNKLNAAFAFGGGELLCETIEQNFGIKLDGYVRVNFAGFRKLIDSLGGVEIELTEAEAQYLNTTNYISDKTQRNVVPGKQIATGTQALGYCRVRKRAAINGENDDFGRTYRQRAVLSQVYDKVKELNVVDAVSLVNELLPSVTTNIGKVDILNYAKAVLQMNIPEIEQKRIPINGAYSGQRLYCGESLVLNFELNNKELWNFIYGDGVGDIITIHPQSVVTSTVTADPATRTYAPYVPAATKAPTVFRTTTPTRNPGNPVATQAPAATPAATPAPVATQAPAATQAPVATQAPEPTKAPVATHAPEPTKAPVTTKAPVATKAPVVTHAPEPEPVDDGTVG